MTAPAPFLKAVAEVDDAAAESVLVDELKVGARVGRQCGELVDQPGDESLCWEVRATDQRRIGRARHPRVRGLSTA